MSRAKVRSWERGYFNLGLVLLLIVSVSVEVGFVGLSKLGHWKFSFSFDIMRWRESLLSMGYVLNALALTFSWKR